jgi:nucleotide-binding universal stress UspA family protein
MKNTEQLQDVKAKVLPFTVTQAIVGLESSPSDNSLISYVDFFTKKIPTTSVFFIHVEPDMENFSELFFERDPEFKLELLESENTKVLQNQVDTYFTGGDDLDVEIAFRAGKPLEVLLSASEEMKADLVVIGQKKGTKHHGILAKKFARKAKGNALIIPEKSVPKIKTILVPIDFSENSARALQIAVGIKKHLGESVKLIALNIFQMPNLSSYKITRTPAQLKSYAKGNIKEAFENFLDKYVPEEKDEIDVQAHFKDSPKMAGHIYNFASNNDVDFIVMGAKGHSRLERLLMGSVTEKMLSINQTFPTMVVK